ncbi:MAG TPA: ABC transporter ATP-binding protein, partial [Burkholderiaceae bacterium]|nr:ABC transporter ATP-binding protein [Burkholderiaceae bacterium]
HQTVFMITHDVDEAILLADKVMMMTSNTKAGPPARIAEIVEITLPRNRTRHDIHHDPQYYRIRNHLVDFLVNRADTEAARAGDPRHVTVVRPGLEDEAPVKRAAVREPAAANDAVPVSVAGS